MADIDGAAMPAGGHAGALSHITLEQLCRALAAHVLMSAHPHLLHGVLAPETVERKADYIHRFALGEGLARPVPSPENANHA